ncbi:hypothetical protein HK100_011178 [Physocladia obscura]|uniref:Uncharacterized protein n=1 Tax=Physocladia obscura TaxID=109957 RepID=A0AAD5T1R7_9FUNG|nr:hypothetical protein HK100_011178 [Physocladia obscura]
MSKERASTPPELFAKKCRSISQMEDRDKDQDEELRKLVERSSSKVKVDRSSHDDLKEMKKTSSVYSEKTKSLNRSTSCRVPGSVRK